jgi:group I intron endonuclease
VGVSIRTALSTQRGQCQYRGQSAELSSSFLRLIHDELTLHESSRAQNTAEKTNGCCSARERSEKQSDTCGSPLEHEAARMVSMRTAIVYAIRNMKTGKFYVGSTWDLQGRWDGHRKALAAGDHSPKLQAAWDATAPSDWEWTVLEEGIPITNQFASEQYWITALDAYENGYNSSPRAGSFVGIRRQGTDYVLEREADIQKMLRQIESKRPYREIAADFGVSVGFLAKLKQVNGELLVELDAARSAQRPGRLKHKTQRAARRRPVYITAKRSSPPRRRPAQ